MSPYRCITLFSAIILISMFQAASVAQQPERLVNAESAWTSFDESIAAAKSSMMGAPQTALEEARAGEDYARAQPVTARRIEALATSLWLQAEALTRLNRAEEAVPVLVRALEHVEDTTSKLYGDLLLTKGRQARVLGRDGEALEAFQTAYRVFEPLGEARSQAMALQSIGTLYDQARQYERVIEYYARASAVYSDDAMLDMVSLNNRANAYRELEEYDEARALLKEALAMAEKSGSAMLQVRVLTNLAVLDIRSGDYVSAKEIIAQAMGKTDSKDAMGWKSFVWGASAQLEYATGKTQLARTSIEKAFEGLDIEATPAPFRDFHETAANIYRDVGEAALALRHFQAFKKHDDEGRNVAASANLALMNAEFEFANKELEIEKLRTSELEKSIALSEIQDRQRRMNAIVASVAGLVLILFFGWSAYTARRNNAVTKALNDALEVKNDELSNTNIDLEKANQAKTEFLATTSHEIRTPLNAIIGLSDVVMTSADVSEQNREYLQMVNSAGRGLLDIVSDILDMSKLEAGRMVVNKTACNVSEIVRDVAELWHSHAGKKGLDFVIDIAESKTHFETDERLLRQILSNLCSNAVKFTDQGSVRVSLDQLKDTQTDGFSVTVSDTGIGIPTNKQKEIFEPFRQADNSLQRNHEGTGLGLAITHRIVNALGGAIRLESRVDQGTTINVTLPCTVHRRKAEAKATETQKSCSASQDPVALADVKVLVVEDNALNAIVIERFLHDHVKKVDIVGDGLEAVDHVQQESYDIILMDKRMPVMDGIEATEAIRKLIGPVKDIPIIGITADVHSGSREEMLAAGADSFLAKPLTREVLLNAIETGLASDRLAKAS